jgi:hypothetical protein
MVSELIRCLSAEESADEWDVICYESSKCKQTSNYIIWLPYKILKHYTYNNAKKQKAKDGSVILPMSYFFETITGHK